MLGTLVFNDIGAGSWTLRTDAGDVYALSGEVPKALAGRRVKVEGEIQDGGGFGFAMQGNPVIWVTRVVAA